MSAQDLTVTDCWFDGKIVVESIQAAVGGIVGYADVATVKNCMVTTTDMSVDEGGNTCWVAYALDGTVKSCYWPDDDKGYAPSLLTGVGVQGTAVSDFNSEDVLKGLQANAAGIEWVAGINQPTFGWLPADYSKVDEAIAKAGAIDKNKYKDFSAVETAISDVKRDKKMRDQADVNAMAKAIEDAIAALQLKYSGGGSSEVAVPEKTVKELSEKTDANLVIKTDNGKVDLDKTALDAVAAQAGTTGTVKLIVETVKTDENICHVDLKLVTSNGNVTDFRGGNVKVTINLDKELAAKELVCVYINDNGIYTKVDGVLNADGTYTFTTGHFSEYAVMAKDAADKAIADQLNTLTKEIKLTARTSKTAKKNIKVVVNGDVTALKDAGYTVKYKFYRSTNKASKYTAKVTKDTNTYTNTTGKKGTKYYYKAKVLVYDGDTLVAQTALKQCKYGARFWTK